MYQQRKERTKEQLPWWRRLQISELGLRIVLVSVILVGGFGYLVLTTAVATHGLKVKDLSDQLDHLALQRAELQAEVDRLQSMTRLERVTSSLDLVRVSQIDYVTTGSGAVAAR
jgi:cell division protein FtsL